MRTSLLAATAITACAAVSVGSLREAHAQVTQPFTGVTLVRHGGRAMAIADLCAPGVSLRATKYGERKRTPESWGNLVGAHVAVNADFFDFPAATHVNGRARGAGEDWPAANQNVELTALGEVRNYWQFGPGLAALVTPSTTAPAAGATDIVGAHNVIIRNGKSLAPNFDGDGVVLGAFRRTGIGVNASRSRVYLFASNDTLSGANMASTMLAYAAEGGAPDLDAASNEDGGGSSQMFVRGQGQIVTSGRLVANHLGIVAKGSGPAPMCPNKAPAGHLDGADCETLTGWTQDPDEPAKAASVHFYFDGPPGTPNVRALNAGPAGETRADLCKPLGSCDHAFVVPTPFGIFDGKEHTVFAYGIDTKGGANPELADSRKKITCAASAPKSIRRHVADAATFAAWGFDTFVDVLTLSEADLTAFAEGQAVASPPVLVRADDKSPQVWLVDGTERRHVPSAAAARAWHFDLAKVITKPAAEVHALTEGAPLRSRPWLAKGSGPSVYLLDGLPGEVGVPGSSGGPGGSGGTGGTSGTSDGDGVAGDESATDEGCATSGQRGDASGGVLVAAAAAIVALVSKRRRRR